MKKEININLENDKSISFKYYKYYENNEVSYVIITRIYDKEIKEPYCVWIKEYKDLIEKYNFKEKDFVDNVISTILTNLLGEKLTDNWDLEKIRYKDNIIQKLIDNENKEIFVTDLFRIVLK